MKKLFTGILFSVSLLGLSSQVVVVASEIYENGTKELAQNLERDTQRSRSITFSGTTSTTGMNTRVFVPNGTAGYTASWTEGDTGYTASWTEGDRGNQRNYTALTIRRNPSTGAETTARVRHYNSNNARRTTSGASNSQNHHLSFRTGLRQDAFGIWVPGYSTRINNGTVNF